MAVPPPFAYMIAFGGKAGWMPCYISIHYVTLFKLKLGRGSKIEEIIKSGDMKEKGVKSQETHFYIS